MLKFLSSRHPLRSKSCFSSYQKQKQEDLARKTIKNLIELNGPMSIAHYMRLCLIHPQFGYYTTGNRDNSIIGSRGAGDFVTSPEISGMFGDMLAVWMVSQLNGSSLADKQFRLVELGPGKATLISDILSCWKRDFPSVYERLSGVDLVEQSPIMRKYQQESLSHHIRDLKWHDHVESLTSSDTREEASVILAHEFFDALPIHQFQQTSSGLREIMIDTVEDSDEFRIGLSRDLTPAAQSFQQYYRDQLKAHVSDSILEWSPESGYVMQTIVKLINSNNGFGLIVDYGRHGLTGHSTFRAIQNHEYVDPLYDPGNCDLTADVDFAYLSSIASSHDGIHASKVISQRDFLLKMGIQMRVKQFLKSIDNPREKERLLDSYSRLTSNSQMGESYKFIAITKQSADVYPFI